MTKKPIVPHVVIEGSRTLARWLYDNNSPQPVVLTSSLSDLRFQIPFRACDLIRPAPDADYFPGYGREWLVELLERERRRLGCKNEPLRLVVAGSHGSLWYNQSKAVDGLHPDADAYLDQVAPHQRRFARDLYAGLQDLKQFKFHWLADALPAEFRPSTATATQRERFKEIIDAARSDLAAHRPLQTIGGAPPLLYTYRRSRWELFRNGYLAFDPKGAATETRYLLEQYKAKPGDMAVLVKLLPADGARHNPCDNPMVSLADLELAKARDVSTVLLDARRGVIDRTGRDEEKEKAEVIGI